MGWTRRREPSRAPLLTEMSSKVARVVNWTVKVFGSPPQPTEGLTPRASARLFPGSWEAFVGNVPRSGAGPPQPEGGVRLGEVVCEERLGGLLKHYRRAA